MEQRATIPQLVQMKERGERIAMLTAYDYPTGRLLDEAGVDIVLVGDSLGMVVLGYDSTTRVTMEEMLHHAKAVRRGVRRALVVGDMPFLSFHGSLGDTVRNAGRFIQEAGCDAVKVEWRVGIEDAVKAIRDAGIAVMGHVGLTPQTAQAEGGFKVRGRDAASAARILAQAVSLEEVGCFSVVLECIPEPLGGEITQRLRVPTIGIGAGRHCDGQVLVTHDLLGLYDRFRPKFAKAYVELGGQITQAARAYVADVRDGRFPTVEQIFTMPDEAAQRLHQEFGS